MINEEGLRDWFGKSKSKDGKKGWVNVVTGDSCHVGDKPGEGVPKCVSSERNQYVQERKRAASKEEEKTLVNNRSLGQLNPTMVKTDRKTKRRNGHQRSSKTRRVRVQVRRMLLS